MLRVLLYAPLKLCINAQSEIPWNALPLPGEADLFLPAKASRQANAVQHLHFFESQTSPHFAVAYGSISISVVAFGKIWTAILHDYAAVTDVGAV
ncbi:hypothetical protein MY4824_009512 [Beauveria thailandica]